MTNKYFFKKLYEIQNKDIPGFMCYYECFMGDFDGYVPFDDDTQAQFPVLNSTKYANENAIDLEVAKALGELSQIPEPFENHYNKKIEQILKLFSSYSNKAKELLNVLNKL